MGMAIEVEIKRSPRGKGLIVCDYCDAEYSNNGGWVKGYRILNGTAGSEFIETHKIPKGVCPICEKPPIDD